MAFKLSRPDAQEGGRERERRPKNFKSLSPLHFIFFLRFHREHGSLHAGKLLSFVVAVLLCQLE